MLRDWEVWLEEMLAAWAQGKESRPFPAKVPPGTEPEPADTAKPMQPTLVTPEVLAELERHRGQWLT